jgi:hypothetical protein
MGALVDLIFLLPGFVWHLLSAGRVAEYARSLGYSYKPWFLASLFASPFSTGLAAVCLPDRGLAAWRRYELDLLERELANASPPLGPGGAIADETINHLSTLEGTSVATQTRRAPIIASAAVTPPRHPGRLPENR